MLYIEEQMKRFKLVDMRKSYMDLIEQAKGESLGYLEFLVRLLHTEDEGKNQRREKKLLGGAHFERTSTLNDIDYGFNPNLDKAKIEDLGRLYFLKAKENIILIGPPGVGKSMIATGIGINACKAGYKVLFTNAYDLTIRLADELDRGHLPQLLRGLNKIDLLIIDELSYLKMDHEKESLFFQLIRNRYEKGSLIITTNLPIGSWDEVFTGQMAATAILDRLLHHAHVLSIPGDSYRVKGSKHNGNIERGATCGK
jgi:DNA replication protein DnaC